MSDERKIIQPPARNYYHDIDSMWIDMMNECLIYGLRLDSREGGCFETIGWSGTLQAGANTLLTNERRALSASYAGAENLWYMSLTGDIEMIKAYAPQYPRWANDGVMLGAVGRRMAGTDPRLAYGSLIQSAITLLAAHPETRQCVLSMWEQNDLEDSIDGDCKNVPCYIAFQAFVREGADGPQLNWVTTMRSNDVWLGAPYDIFAFSLIQRTIASELGLKVGTYTHQVGSMHVYDKHLASAKQAIEKHEAQLKAGTYRYAEPSTDATPREEGGRMAWVTAIETEASVRHLLKCGSIDDATKCAIMGVAELGDGYVSDCLSAALLGLFNADASDDMRVPLPCPVNPYFDAMLQRELQKKEDGKC